MKSTTKTILSGGEAAKAVAGKDWLECLERYDGRPDDFLGLFTELGIKALYCAACDKLASPEDRASAGYRLACAIKQAADALSMAFPVCGGNESIPDCGIHKATVVAVDAMHRVAREHSAAFRWLPHELEWPVLLAPDGSVLSSCVSAEEMKYQPLGSATGLATKKAKRGKGKRVRLGGRWQSLATRLLYRVTLGQREIGFGEAWPLIQAELDRSRSSIMSEPEIERWATAGANKRSKEYTVWSRLRQRVKRALQCNLRA